MKNSAEKRILRQEALLHGFSLHSVCWGYREIIAEILEKLLAEGLIGTGDQEKNQTFFGFLKQANQGCFDHVVKEFITAINPKTAWLLEIPGLFAEFVQLGHELAESKLHHGTAFFKIWGEGGFGDTPQEVRQLLEYLRRLHSVDADLAVSFLHGYSGLRKRLDERETDIFLEHGLQLYRQNPRQAFGFMRMQSKRAENIVCSITRECRLEERAGKLASLLRALVGYEVEIGHLGQLDSDDLQEHGSQVVCLHKWLYLPLRIRHFSDARQNSAWYLLTALVAASMLANDSFPKIHGLPEYQSNLNLVGSDQARINLFSIVEYTRIADRMRGEWPGAAGLLDWGRETELSSERIVPPVQRLLHDCLAFEEMANPTACMIRELAAKSINCFDTASLLDRATVERCRNLCPGLGDLPLRPLAFLPDFTFPGAVSKPPPNSLVADLRQAAEKRAAGDSTKEADKAVKGLAQANDSLADKPNADEAEIAAAACFTYDEWNQEEKDYLKDYCLLFERPVSSGSNPAKPDNAEAETRKVKLAFERLKPEIVKKRKHLSDGDAINPELLVEFMIARQREPSPRVDFYEKPLVSTRDLAALILLDVSGSTGGRDDQRKIIDIEKRAALIFAEGLSALDDDFAVCGFNSNGRERCEYFIYKDFHKPWGSEAIARVNSAFPAGSTRIGPALRHSGEKLAQRNNRQRLLILITDGKPMDSEYDPGSRYAQYDVRKACQENLRRGVLTFAISTEDNTDRDLELMFGCGRFLVAPGLRTLPAILPRLYLKITT